MNTKTNNKVFSMHRVEGATSSYDLPYQELAKNFFITKKIGRGPSIVSSGKLGKILRLGKYRYLEVAKNPFATATASIAVLAIGIFLFSSGKDFLTASITDTPSPLAFDGTVYPYEYAPDWFTVGGKNTRSYSSYSSSELVKAPRYELSNMQNEDWNRKYVNPKITYSIVYMGKYKFDHKENTGSHPAVDIKLAPGTPVYSIANGIVVKSKSQATGYGKHVVVRHDNVPEYGTLYSSYSHFSKLSVNVGDTVKRGQQIGEVGSTGNSTTAHIHFQVDRKDAPFYPYWPFTTSEASNAGYGFTSAVNAGFGKENALKYTIHPFEFIHKYEKGTTLLASNNTHSSAVQTSAATVKPTAVPTEIPARKESKTLSSFKLDVSPNKIIEGENVKLSALAANEDSEFFETFSEKVLVEYETKAGKKSTEIFMRSGEAETQIMLDQIGTNKLYVSFGSVKEMIEIQVVASQIDTKTDTVTVVDTDPSKLASNDSLSDATEESVLQEFARFEVYGHNEVKVGESIPLIIKAIDSNGNEMKTKSFPSRGSFIIESQNGQTDTVQIRKGDLANGHITVNFTGKDAGVGFIKIEDIVHEIKVKADAVPEKISSNASVFTDVPSGHKNSEALRYLKAQNIIGGYSDGSFKPDNTVNRSEALKMIFEAMNVSIRNNLENPFNDVSQQDWFKGYVLSAYNMDIVKGYSDGSFKPGKTVGRAEYFKILLNTSNLPLGGMPKKDPFSDVPKNSWFAEYAEFSKNQQLLDFGTAFLPTQGMTRGEVAESIYRLVQ